METILKIEQIEKYYGNRSSLTKALDTISFEVEKGEFIAIMGASGSGKTTLLNCISTLDKVSSGKIYMEGDDITRLKGNQLNRFRREKLGFIFQSFHLIPSLNVLDNVLLPMLYRRGSSASANKKRALELIEKVGLTHRLKHFPSQLSGGQCQRVAIARALIGQPKVILADEPTGNLDSKMGTEIMDLLVQLNREGTTIVMVTHDERLAEETGRIIRLFDGKLVL